jgi:hypothetical protein
MTAVMILSKRSHLTIAGSTGRHYWPPSDVVGYEFARDEEDDRGPGLLMCDDIFLLVRVGGFG